MQPAPASAGEESEEDQQFRTIFQQIAGDVSNWRPGIAGGTVSVSMAVMGKWLLHFCS